MAKAVSSGPLTPADELRELLDRSERRVVSPEEGGGVPELFDWMDQMAELWPSLDHSGADLRAEWTRWEGLQSQVLQRGRRLLRAWPAQQGLPEYRRAVGPPETSWWWWLDEKVSQARRRRLLRWLAVVGAVIVVAVGAILLFNRLFPVDPVVQEVYRLQSAADGALQQGDVEQARQLIEEAVQTDPTDPGLQALFGVLLDVSGDEVGAEGAWADARALLENDEGQFLTIRGRAYMQVNDLEKALRDEQAAVELKPDSAQAQFLLGVAYELTDDFQLAVEAYTRAAELADDGNPELVVLARTRIAAILHQPELPVAPEASP
jgi:Tfp pilus assembly protein PilF